MSDTNSLQEDSSKLHPNEYDGRPTMLGLYGQSLKALAAAIALTYAGARLASHNPAQPPQERPPHTAPAPTRELVGPTVTPNPTVTDILSRLASHTATDVPTQQATPESSSTTTPSLSGLDTTSPTPTTTRDNAPVSQTPTIPALPTHLAENSPTPLPPTSTPTTTQVSIRNPDTATPRPTTETTDALIERLQTETGISLKLIKDLSSPDIDGTYSMQETSADTQLKRILASTILRLPKGVIDAFKKKYKTIYIGRVLKKVSTYVDEKGVVNFRLNTYPSNYGEHVGIFDIADGPDYDSTTSEPNQLSGLPAETEAQITVEEEAQGLYLLTPEGNSSLKNFVIDNPIGIDFTNPQVKEFLELLYFPYYGDGSDDLPYEELIARMRAMNITGLGEKVTLAIKVATDAKLLNFDHAPLIIDP